MVDELAPPEVARRLKAAHEVPLLLDVREDDERSTARIDPSVHIRMSEVPARLGELPRDRPIVVYCHHGTRSAMVAGYLEAMGFEHIANLTGGIDAWSLEVDARVARYQ